MSFKYIVLNLLSLFVVLLVARENYRTWNYPPELFSDKEVTKKTETKAEVPTPVGMAKEPFPVQSYISVAEKNIFSPERKDFPIVPVEQSKTNVRPQVVLYGVTIAEDYQAASITSPGRPLRKGERESLTLKVGEKIGNYKLAKVFSDRIMLENNGDSFEVLLYDTRVPKKRMEVKTETKPPVVTATQLAPAPPAPPVPQATPPASVEKPKEPPQQQVVPPTPTPTPRPIPPLWQRRRGIPVYPPTSPPFRVPGQATERNN